MQRSLRYTNCPLYHWLTSLSLLLSVVACSPSDVPLEEPEEEPTQEPGPPLRKTTWSAYITEDLDPMVSSDTVVYFNIETQENGKITGWLWHIWGDLEIGGYEVPENQVIALEGTYTWERHLVVSGSLYGHTATLDALIFESGHIAEVTLRLDTDQYEWWGYFSTNDYVTVNPQ